MTDFRDTPVSITELRAERTQRADKWTPRDVLIALLRDIDQGKIEPHRLIVAYSVKVEGGTQTRFQASVDGNHEALGLLARASFLINAQS